MCVVKQKNGLLIRCTVSNSKYRSIKIITAIVLILWLRHCDPANNNGPDDVIVEVREASDPLTLYLTYAPSRWINIGSDNGLKPLHCQVFHYSVQMQIKENQKFRVTGHSSVTGEFPAQKASNAENVPLMTSSCPTPITVYNQSEEQDNMQHNFSH